MQADKEGVEDIHKWIVNLPIADVVDAPGFHVGQRTAFVKGFQAATMSIGAGGDICPVGEQYFAV